MTLVGPGIHRHLFCDKILRTLEVDSCQDKRQKAV